MNFRRIRMALLVPIHSLMLAGEILTDGINDLITKIKFAFARGPISELGEYATTIRVYFRQRFNLDSRRRKQREDHYEDDFEYEEDDLKKTRLVETSRVE